MFGARGKILGFGVTRWVENTFPSLVPWTYQFAKAPHFLYCVPQNILSLQLLCQFNCQSRFLSHLTTLSLTPGSTTGFFFKSSLRGSWVILYNLERKTITQYLNPWYQLGSTQAKPKFQLGYPTYPAQLGSLKLIKSQVIARFVAKATKPIKLGSLGSRTQLTQVTWVQKPSYPAELGSLKY